MAESKQYITNEQENGSVIISEDVIATIVAHAVSEVEGIAGLSLKPGADIVELIGRKNWYKGIKITVGENGELSIDCNVSICYGQSVVAVANAAQETIISAVESMAGVKVSAVNVNVCDIVRE